MARATTTTKKEEAAPPGAAAAAGLRTITAELAEMYFEREEEIRALAVALLARQHIVLVGPPGTAKSELAREFTSRIVDARFFDYEFNEFTEPTMIFGPPDLGALMRGEYRQVLEGRATQAEIMFLDEVFNCGVALHALHGLLNERLYHPESGGPPIECPLISAVAATNKIPEGNMLLAFYDRLLIRLEVGYLQEAENFARMLAAPPRSAVESKRTTVPLADVLEAVHKGVPAVELPRSVITQIATLRARLGKEGLTPSDRRWRQCADVLRASAFLDGRTRVEPSDLMMLVHCLWHKPSQRTTVERIVMKLADPDQIKLADLVDALDKLEAGFNAIRDTDDDAARSEWVIRELTTNMRRAKEELIALREKASRAGRPTDLYDEAIARRKALAQRMSENTLGLDAEDEEE